MGLFNKKKEEENIEEKPVAEMTDALVTKKKNVSKKTTKKVDLKEEKSQPAGDGQMAYKFIVRPWITEKAQELMNSSKYIFRLRAKTTKREAKVAVEKLYNVRVAGVNIINIPQKVRKFGRYTGKKSAIRKAIVTLKKGDKIEVFE
ncbi:MAG: 50S ribosomal protein L23 [Candidatus Moraniibacteriota bacterium]